MEEIDKIRKKLIKDSGIDIDDSDIPVHEKFVKEKNLKKLKK